MNSTDYFRSFLNRASFSRENWVTLSWKWFIIKHWLFFIKINSRQFSIWRLYTANKMVFHIGLVANFVCCSPGRNIVVAFATTFAETTGKRHFICSSRWADHFCFGIILQIKDSENYEYSCTDAL